MNTLINGWNSADKGAVTSVLDVALDHVCDRRYGLHTCRFEILSNQPLTYFNYRATPYRCLKRLYKHLAFDGHDHLVDLGCGKGRVFLYAAIKGCPQVTGVEYNEEMAAIAERNLHAVAKRTDARVQLLNIDARKLEIAPSMNHFFLFTPFHLKIFMRILKKIKSSYRVSPRKIAIILYRPDSPWIEFMQQDDLFTYVKTIRIFNDEMFALYYTE